uniref:Flap endonuclease GEN homolog 1 n=1 Tax=Phallusia mammillata TaxID=59560 RepID=A0A6F9DEA2_9ASCI|nr:flap endonuclease GEN homolog 1 [Phallusia mammillata]
MGVKCLWEILQDVKATRSLSDLRDQTLAVDLAAWICEAESVRHMQNAVKNPYIRNLFYRVSVLLDHGVRMIFVTDGTPPDLKRDTIAKRLGKESGSFSRGSRNRLNSKFKECCQLLDQIGIPWLKSDGEAEAMCAYLNNEGMADACVTSDGDVFLYGARKVYRNFTTDKRHGEIEYYDMDVIEEKLTLNRRSLVALGLILGCDYCDGVHGIGKVQALDFLKIDQNSDPIYQLKKLVRNVKPVINEEKKPTHCSFCKHKGSKKDHLKSGCDVCYSNCKLSKLDNRKCTCSWHAGETVRKQKNLEISIWEKAKQDPSFPDQNVINEFLRERKIVTNKKLQRKRPNLKGIAELVSDKLDWSEERGVEKALPIWTNWIYVMNEQGHQAKPLRIVKERKKEGTPMFEVVWEICDCDVDEITALEPQSGFKEVFPDMANEFLQEKEKQQKEKKKKPSKKKDTEQTKGKKMTDFYGKKKIPNLEKMEKIQPTQDTSKKGVIEILDDKAEVLTPKSPTKRGSEDIDTLASVLASVSIASRAPSDAEPPKTHDVTSDDVSFALNFSLGSSLLQTPVPRPNREKIDLAIIDKENLGDTAVKIPETESDIKSPPSSALVEPGSPVFMTLADRLRLREKN